MRLFILAFVLLAACATGTQAPAQPAAAASGELAIITSPRGGQITSPLHVTGIAPADWYFENQFPVRLLDLRERVIAEAPAHPRVNWTENADPKEFDAELTFTVSGGTMAYLVLQEAMPGEGETPREVRVPVLLMPAR